MLKDLEEKLRALKLRKARLLDEVEMLTIVSDLLFIKIGKIVVEITKIEKEIVCKTENDLE